MTTPGRSDETAFPSAAPWYERHWPWLAGGIALITVVVNLSLVNPIYLTGPDPVKYADLARSLAREEGYRFNGGTEAKHPPGFPILLALLFKATPDPFPLARAMIVLAAGLALYLAGTLVRRAFGAGVALTALVCVGASVPLWWSTRSLLSEYPYAVFQNLALILLVRFTTSEAPRRRDALLLGMATAAAVLIRPIGMTLIATCAYTLLRGRLAGKLTRARALHSALLAIGVPVLAFGAWRAYATACVGVVVPENVSIFLRRGHAIDGGAAFGSMIVETARNMLARSGGLIFGDIVPSDYPSVEPFLWATLLIVWAPVPIALVVRGLGRAEPVWTFLGIYLTTIAVWPLASGATARLCWPVAPLLAGLLLASYRWLAGAAWQRRGPLVVSTVMVAAVGIGQIALGGRVWRRMRASETFWAARMADLEMLRDRYHPAPPDVWANLNVREAVYVFDMPTQVVEFTWHKDPERWAWEMDEYHPDYVVVPTTPAQVENARLFVETLTRLRPAAACIAELDTVSLYQVHSDAPRR